MFNNDFWNHVYVWIKMIVMNEDKNINKENNNW